MKPPRCLSSLSLFFLACLGRDPLPEAPRPLLLRSLRSPTGSLDELNRFAELTLTFDRAVSPPSYNSVILIASPASPALLSDAAHGELSAANEARRVPCRVSRDPGDPSVLRVRAESPQQPDRELSLLITTAVFAEDLGELSTPDAGARVIAFALRISPAKRCGPVASFSLIAPDSVPGSTSSLLVRFDRPVRSNNPLFFRIVRSDGRDHPSRASLDCPVGDRMFLCGRVEPSVALAPDTRYSLVLSGLEGRNGRPVESPEQWITARSLASWPRATFTASPVCAADEVSRGAFCARALGSSFELRALTTHRAVLVATVTDGRSTATSFGAAGVSHVLRVSSLSPGTVHSVRVRALGLDGRADASEVVWPLTAALWAPRVRIGEVLARPRGASAQEFVELVNDETVSVSVAGWTLAQGASRVLLPVMSTVPARGRAVVVARMFDPRGGSRGDSPVASGSGMIVVPSVARGLRDIGDDLGLIDPSGALRSMLPGSAPELAPRQGVGLVRCEPELADQDPAAWGFDARGESSPGAPDALR